MDGWVHGWEDFDCVYVCMVCTACMRVYTARVDVVKGCYAYFCECMCVSIQVCMYASKSSHICMLTRKYRRRRVHFLLWWILEGHIYTHIHMLYIRVLFLSGWIHERRIHTYIHTYTYTCILFLSGWILKNAYMHACMHINMYSFLRDGFLKDIHTQIQAYMCMIL
jgi:hypothetical protein